MAMFSIHQMVGLWGGGMVRADSGMTPRFLASACTLVEVSNTEEVKVWEEKTINSVGHVT